MKRAPIIPKSTPSPAATGSSGVPAAPMIDSLVARVGAMTKGNTIVLPVCGRDVKFVLETIDSHKVEVVTRVWAGNERVQELLTRDALDDLIPSFLLNGQQNPAFGRQVKDSIEVADGSRRRMTAILTSSDYRVLVGDLDDEQMDALCKLGNDYRPTSAYERGRRYARKLENEFAGNVSALAEAEGISRKIITRCVNTSKLPQEVISLFSHPGELSARAGEQLHKAFIGKELSLIEKAQHLASAHKDGLRTESEVIFKELLAASAEADRTSKTNAHKKEFGPGAVAQYKGNKIVISLDRTKVPGFLIEQLETLLTKHQ